MHAWIEARTVQSHGHLDELPYALARWGKAQAAAHQCCSHLRNPVSCDGWGTSEFRDRAEETSGGEVQAAALALSVVPIQGMEMWDHMVHLP